MSFRLWRENLPVTQHLASTIDLSDRSVIVVQHAVSDTVRFLSHLQTHTWANIHFISKPYSGKPKRIKEIMALGIEVSSKQNYEQIEKPGFLEHILDRAKGTNKLDPLILEVWWCFVRPLQTHKTKILGAVEVTTFGHKRYENAIGEINSPVYSIARSAIKEEEANHVGQSVVTSLEVLLKELWRNLSSGKILMVWYGMIGKSVVTALNWRKTCVSVYDTDHLRRHEATQRGFDTNSDIKKFFKRADMIISSTGQMWITKEIIDGCLDGTILVSAWSRQNEIDMNYLEEQSSEKTQIHEYVTRYIINGKEIFVVRDGKNVNFIGESCPDNCMDLIHAGVLACTKKLLDTQADNRPGIIHGLWELDIDEIYRLHEQAWYGKGLAIDKKRKNPIQYPPPVQYQRPVQWDLFWQK